MIIDKFYLWRYGLIHADNIPTHLTPDEKIALFNMAHRLPPGAQCLEIGSYLGASAFFIARGLRVGGRLFCIDTWMNDAMAYTEDEKNNAELQPRNTFQEFTQNIAAVSERIIALRGASGDMVANISKYSEALQFVFIDGDHSYTAVKEDVRNCKQLLRR